MANCQRQGSLCWSVNYHMNSNFSAVFYFASFFWSIFSVTTSNILHSARFGFLCGKFRSKWNKIHRPALKKYIYRLLRVQLNQFRFSAGFLFVCFFPPNIFLRCVHINTFICFSIQNRQKVVCEA